MISFASQKSITSDCSWLCLSTSSPSGGQRRREIVLRRALPGPSPSVTRFSAGQAGNQFCQIHSPGESTPAVQSGILNFVLKDKVEDAVEGRTSGRHLTDGDAMAAAVQTKCSSNGRSWRPVGRTVLASRRGSSVLGAVTQAASGRVADLSSRKLSRRCSAARSASADTVGVGFTTPPVANVLPSTMNRFGTSQAWCQRLTTEDSGDAPMRQVPRRFQAGVL